LYNGFQQHNVLQNNCLFFKQPEENMQNVRENVTLSSGRVIAHTREPNGSQLATPTTGSNAMTDDEWLEYVSITNPKVK
jgi:hypothetical protein